MYVNLNPMLSLYGCLASLLHGCIKFIITWSHVLFFSLVQVHEGIRCFLCARRLLLRPKRFKYTLKIAIGTFYAFQSRIFMILSCAGVFGLIFFGFRPCLVVYCLFCISGNFPGLPVQGRLCRNFPEFRVLEYFSKFLKSIIM